MATSLVLLTTFQVLWILNSYEGAFYDLRRDANILFKSTVTNMRLSTMMKNMVQVTDDSLKRDTLAAQINVVEFDSLKIARRSPKQLRKNVQVFVESADGRALKKGQMKFFRDSTTRTWHEPTFVIRMTEDTVSVDSIRKHYQTALVQARIDARFEILRMDGATRYGLPPGHPLDDILMDGEKEFAQTPNHDKRKQREKIYADTIHSEPVRYSPFQLYTANIFGVRSMILKKVAPEILFSLLLTGIISAAFVMMYRTLRAQHKLMEIKNDFISNVTHELKTPVATVSVALEALKNFNALENPKRTAEYLEIAQSELNRLTLMTDKILKTSVFENKGIEFVLENVAIDRLAEQVIGSMKLLLEKRRITLTYDKTGDRFNLQGAETHLTNVLFNLVDNAIKYSAEGTEVKLQLTSDAREVVVSITDHGIGIPKEYHDKIFEKFFRVPSGDIHNIKGYGLGLSYVAAVIRQHGGTISVTSQVNHGSTFTIKLPKGHDG